MKKRDGWVGGVARSFRPPRDQPCPPARCPHFLLTAAGAAIHAVCTCTAQVDDLYSYFRFLRYKPYCDPASFKELIKDRIANDPAKGYQMLQVVLQVRQ